MFSDLESEWSKAFGQEVEIYELGTDYVLHVGGVFHGIFRDLNELEWELDNMYQMRDEGMK